MRWGSLPRLLHEGLLLELSDTHLVSLGIIRHGIPMGILGDACIEEDKA